MEDNLIPINTLSDTKYGSNISIKANASPKLSATQVGVDSVSVRSTGGARTSAISGLMERSNVSGGLDTFADNAGTGSGYIRGISAGSVPFKTINTSIVDGSIKPEVTDIVDDDTATKVSAVSGVTETTEASKTTRTSAISGLSGATARTSAVSKQLKGSTISDSVRPSATSGVSRPSKPSGTVRASIINRLTRFSNDAQSPEVSDRYVILKL